MRKKPKLVSIVKQAAEKNKRGYDIIFDENGKFRQYVIILQNANRIDTSDAENIMVVHDDGIAVFLPVSGG